MIKLENLRSIQKPWIVYPYPIQRPHNEVFWDISPEVYQKSSTCCSRFWIIAISSSIFAVAVSLATSSSNGMTLQTCQQLPQKLTTFPAEDQLAGFQCLLTLFWLDDSFPSWLSHLYNMPIYLWLFNGVQHVFNGFHTHQRATPFGTSLKKTWLEKSSRLPPARRCEEKSRCHSM